MLNIENVKKLRDALESGKYKKGEYVLHTGDDKFCAMGVAIDIATKNGLKIKKQHTSDYEPSIYSYEYDKYLYDGHLARPPRKVIEFYGLSDYDIEKIVELSDSSCDFNDVLDYLDALLLTKGTSENSDS